MPSTFSFETYDDHIIADIEGRGVLVDTGSPFSISRVGALEVFSGESAFSENLMGQTADDLSRMLGHEFDILLGNDVLANHPFVIDWAERSVTFDPERIPDGLEIRTESVMGSVVFDATVNNRETKLVLDTGAKVMFVSPSLVEDLEPSGAIDEFHPMTGPFTANRFEVGVDVGGGSLELEAAELQPMMSMLLMMIGVQAIAGNNLLMRHDKVLIDIPGSRLVLD